jgi:signal transduction histidine kinase
MAARASNIVMWLVAARWVAWLSAALIVLARHYNDQPNDREPFLLVLALAQTGAFSFVATPAGASAVAGLQRRLGERMDARFLLGLTDVLLALVFVELSGGVHSPYYLFAATALLVPASQLGRGGVLLLTVVFLAGYIAALSLSTDGLDQPVDSGDEPDFAAFLAAPLPIALLVQLVSSHARRVAQQEEANRQLFEEKLALERANARLAVEADRARIARDMHDGTGASMYALTLNLEKAADEAGPESALGRRLTELVRLAKAILLDIRSYIFDLRPLLADEEALSAALRNQAKEFSTVAGLPIAVDVAGQETGLPVTHTTALYRITQEALTNAYRHADASEIAIRLVYEPEAVRLEVEDNGTGFRPDDVTSRGLENIAERARQVGGGATVETAAGRGTLVRVVLPKNGHEDHPRPDRR